jgi:hypothetical protein
LREQKSFARSNSRNRRATRSPTIKLLLQIETDKAAQAAGQFLIGQTAGDAAALKAYAERFGAARTTSTRASSKDDSAPAS